MISILNILSFIFLLATIVLFFLVRQRNSRFKEVNLFFIGSFTLLLLVSVTNAIEHAGITAYLDLYEDSLELLFIPFMVFALFSLKLTNEFQQREKAEYFKSKIVSTSPSITYIYNLKENSFTFLSGGRIKQLLNSEKISTPKLINNFLTERFSSDEQDIVKQHYIDIKDGKHQEYPIITEFSVSGIHDENREYQTYETVFSSDENNKPLEIVGVAIDITDKKIAEKKLMHYQMHLENLIKERTIELENSNNKLQISNETLSKSNEELKVLNKLSQRQSQKIERLNSNLLEKNNSLTRANRELTIKQKQLEEAMQTLHDIQEQLIQNEKLSSLGILVAGIAHEINNPVNYISNGMLGLNKALEQIQAFSTEMLECKKNEKGDDNLTKCIELIDKYEIPVNIEVFKTISGHIQSGIEKILNIVASLKQYTRSGHEQFEWSDINNIIDVVLVMLHHEYKHRIQVHISKGSLPQVQCMAGKMNQVIMNIISNAIQAIPDKGEIHISTSINKKNDEVKISVKDNGEGIPANIKKNIFDPFFTTKEVGKGTGLGLSISYDIIKSHRGTINFNSDTKTGTEFIISLPVKQTS